MEQQRREVKPNVQPLSPPKKFVPQPYSALSGVEPFSNQKLTVALKQEARQPNSLLAAETSTIAASPAATTTMRMCPWPRASMNMAV